jgi:hypothetical protein
MGALAKDRVTPRRANEDFSFPVAAGAVIYAGALVALSATGYATPGAVAATLQAVGVAQEAVDNAGGQDGDKTVKVRNGAFLFANSAAGDLIALTEIGETCYIVDDQTVAKTDNGGARSPAGMVVDVDADGVWVFVGYGPVSSPAGALLAANDLSDVADAATARANLAANKIALQLVVDDLLAAGAKVYRVVSPVAGLITKIYSVIDGALAGADASLTGKIGATPITNGAITIAQAGSAAGDVDVATPTAANVVAIGDVISVTVGGGNTDADANAEVTVYIET